MGVLLHIDLLLREYSDAWTSFYAVENACMQNCTEDTGDIAGTQLIHGCLLAVCMVVKWTFYCSLAEQKHKEQKW